MKQIVLALLALSSFKCYAQTLNFSGNDVTLASFMSSVSRQTGYVFFYNASLVDSNRRVSANFYHTPLDSAMRLVLKNQPFSFSVKGRTIFIVPLNTGASEKSDHAPKLLTIRGRITDLSGMALGNASVTAMGSSQSIVASENGNFELELFRGDSLLISSVGYGSKVIYADGRYLNIQLQLVTSHMEQVIIGGNLFATKRKSDISSITIIDSKTLETLPVTNIAEIYRGLVPGTNSFSPGDQPEEFPSLTIRGAGSEGGLAQINVYVDGVQWAGGSGYLSALNKENIDRIEILRGPESSTLYGTGSNGGVVLIYTKKGIPDTNAWSATASAGFIQSKWVPSSAFQQYYTLDKQISFKNTSLLAGGTYQTNGPWIPGGGEKTGTAHLNMKWDPGKKISVDIAGYYAGTNRGVSKNALYDTITHLSDSLQYYYNLSPRKLTNKQTDIRSYFAGLNLTYQATLNWTHHLTAGYSQNGNQERAVASVDTNELAPDKFYQAVDKTTTIRYSNILKLGNPETGLAAGIMSGAEYKNIFYAAKVTGSFPFTRDGSPANINWGLFAQVNMSYKNIYLTTALRYDYNKLFGNNHSLNPRLGLTTNFSISGLIIKPRISWGSGITPPTYENRYGAPSNGVFIVVPNAEIKPQQQSGFDYGVEIYDRRNRFSGEVVYYNNTLKNTVLLKDLPMDANGLYVSQWTNVGAIANCGWEFSGRYQWGSRLSLNGTFSIMQSVIKDSTGDYLDNSLAGKAPGYQLQALPRHTAGLFLTWHCFKLFRKQDKMDLSLNVTEVDGILSVDFIRWEVDVAYGRTQDLNGEIPDRYNVTNGPVFRLGCYFEYHISEALRFFAQGSNMLNSNANEFSSSFTAHGAALLFGFKFSGVK
jgi:outer membrane receptor for ferrienterochelin and colicin